MHKIALLMAALLGAAGGSVAEESVTEDGAVTMTEVKLTSRTLPGTVLLHNHHYIVETGEVPINATPFPGLSALRVPVGASVLLEIRSGASLTVTGGPGYGRIPGGAGIEVPFGSKLVICGGGVLNAVGGAAADGGKGYGGMGGRRCFAANVMSLPDNMRKVYEKKGAKELPYCKKPLPYNVTGTGGDGGDGGGGAGVGIGGRGGPGGRGGRGGPCEMIVYKPTYDKRTNDYDRFTADLKLPPLVKYDLDSARPQLRNGLTGFAGSVGIAGCGCGEIIVTENVVVNVTPGGAGDGGVCGPFGTTTWGYDATGDEPDASFGFGIGATVLGVLGMIPLNPAGAVASGILSTLMSIASLILDATGFSDRATMKKAAWFVGGGGGGGGGSGDAAYFGIGSGGAGGGGGGGGGSGFFGVGIGSVFKTIRSGKIDVTTQPLHVSGHGGRGGRSAVLRGQGGDANPANGGEPELRDYTNKVKYATGPYNGNAGRLGAYSWLYTESLWVFGGLGADGGAAGVTSAKPVTVFRSRNSQVNTKGSGKQPAFRDFSGNRTYEWTFNFHDNVTSPRREPFLCGSLIETITPPVRPPRANCYFNGFFTGENGGGDKVFDQFGFPVPGASVTSNLYLHAHWSDNPPPDGFKNVVNAKTVFGRKHSGNFTLQNGTIYWFPEDAEISSSTSFGLAVPDGGKSVLYIPKGVTVTVVGGNGSGTVPASPAILVPGTSTLVVTGEGALNVTGGNGGAGGPGKGGDKGCINYQTDDKGCGGYGRDGGPGGGGAAPAIGGRGGDGQATGGAYVETKWYNCSNTAFMNDGPNGNDGKQGGKGRDAGKVYILGRIRVSAKSGAVGGAGPGGACGGYAYKKWTNHYIASGGGGGGGGGGGCLPVNVIGGGGGGGGSGGGGGGGFTQYEQQPGGWTKERDGTIAAHGGEGGSGGTKGCTGGTGAATSLSGRHGWIRYGGKGGAGGLAGGGGDDGQLFLGREVTGNANARTAGGTRSHGFVFGDGCLKRTITFKDVNGKPLGQVAAQIGIALPTLPTNLTQCVRGHVIASACESAANGGTAWYGLEGEPLKSSYDAVNDVTLQVEFAVDEWHMADVPQVAEFTYDGENHVGFAADENPGCRYVSGVTNAVNAGVYEYATRLTDGFTVWSDLSTDPVRTNVWVVNMAPITNDWPRVEPWNWKKTPKENEQVLRESFSFLPKGTSVDFVPVDLDLENTVWMEARVNGGLNYLDRVIAGSYGSNSPIDMNVSSYYPWLPVIELNFTPIGEFGDPRGDKFWEIYGEDNLVVTAAIKGQGDDVTTVPILWSNKVSEVRTSGFSVKTFRVNLAELPQNPLKGFRGHLSLYMSIAGLPCRRGSAPVDLTCKLDEKGCPHYDLEDSAKVLPIRCSMFLSDGDITDKTYPEVSVGSPSDPEVFFMLHNSRGEIIQDQTVDWPRGQAGRFKLVHRVRDVKGGFTRYTAYLNIAASVGGGSGPDIVYVERAGTGRIFAYDSLQAAVGDLRYGDCISIYGDVQLELVKIPSGVFLYANKEEGLFRPPDESDLLKPYDKASVMTNDDNVVSARFELDEAQVTPTVLAEDDQSFGPVYDAAGKVVGFRMEIGNVKDDLTYFVRRSTDLNPWTWETVFTSRPEAGRGDRISVEVPAEGDRSFYGVTVTDAPVQKFTTSLNADGETLTITGADGFVPGPFAGKLVIPTEIDGLMVTAIGDGAFAGRTDITAVDVPDGVLTIGAGAFRNCVNLDEVSLPANIREIGEEAFAGTRIPELLLAEGGVAENVGVPVWHPVEFALSNAADRAVTYIVGLDGMPSDGRIRIPEKIGGRTVVGICDEAFAERGGIVEMFVPAGVREIGYSVFRGCSDLTRVIFAGDAPEADEDMVGLDPAKCVVVVNPSRDGWDATWGGCPVEFTGADGRPYRRAEYIESTPGGGQYVDTEYVPNSSTRIVADFNPLEKTKNWLAFFGATGTDSPTNGVQLRYAKQTDEINGWFCNATQNEARIGGFENTRITAELKAGGMTLDGQTAGITTTGTPCERPIYVFCVNNGGTAWRHQAMRLYSFRIYEGGTLVRNFVPCASATAGAGLYDLVKGKFHPNNGDTAFVTP